MIWQSRSGRHRQNANSRLRPRHPRLLLAILLLCSLCLLVAGADGPDRQRRAKPPTFDSSKVSGVFFSDVFAKLQGTRPVKGTAAPTGSAKPGAANAATNTGPSVWDELISASSIEDEVKHLRVMLNESITTPGQFASRGHKAARREFVLLNLLFWIVEHYHGDVRWKDYATVARQQFGSAAGNAKAGGNEQTYTQAKRCRDLLDELIRGEKPAAAPFEEDEITWEPVAPRRPLMQWLEQRFEADLKQWTSSESEFKANAEELLREAELVAAIGQFFKEPGMDDADDAEYQQFCDAMKQGAQSVAAAVKQGDLAAAQKGVGQISQACSNCHEGYR